LTHVDSGLSIPVYSYYNCVKNGTICITGKFLVNQITKIKKCCSTTDCNTGNATDYSKYTIWCYVGILGGFTVQQHCTSTCQVRIRTRLQIDRSEIISRFSNLNFRQQVLPHGEDQHT
jgi:hypothetical protein